MGSVQHFELFLPLIGLFYDHKFQYIPFIFFALRFLFYFTRQIHLQKMRKNHIGKKTDFEKIDFDLDVL